MSLPESLECDRFLLDVIMEAGMEDHGRFRYGKLTIYINPEDIAEVQAATLVHEYFHCVYRLCCDKYDADEDEKFAAMAEKGFMWFLRNNVEWVREAMIDRGLT